MQDIVKTQEPLETHLFPTDFPQLTGHILTVHSNQFCAVLEAECAV